MELQPIQDRVLIEVDEPEEMSPGGIVIPDKAKEKLPQRATVLVVGPGLVKSGVRMPMTVKEGDKVLVERYHGDVIDGGLKRLIVREGSILAVLEDGDARIPR